MERFRSRALRVKDEIRVRKKGYFNNAVLMVDGTHVGFTISEAKGRAGYINRSVDWSHGISLLE